MLSYLRPCPTNAHLSAVLAALICVPVGAADAGELSFAQAALDFGGNALGESKTLTATLNNTTASDVLLGGASLVENSGGYSLVSTTCGATLPARQSCGFTLRFTASTLKPALSRLELTTQSAAFPLLLLPLQANRYPALNDTGITHCGNSTQNGLTCPQAQSPRQDAQNGRDKTRNRAGNGRAGFNYTKLDSQGKALPAAAIYWDCVRDNVTGLVWERKRSSDGRVGDQGLHDADDGYTWYSSDAGHNGGSPGVENPGMACFGYLSGQPVTYCNTEAYVQRVNAEGWCGAKDWRLPGEQELLGLVDLSVSAPGPTIDTTYFPDTRFTRLNYYWSAYYWSSSPDANDARNAWHVYFALGHTNSSDRGNNHAVRLVRGGR
ncbi:DUF1566 domain-containing protein [Candidatus Kaiserbacteria bacterium]|nr:DUF1566 domain-containing protein [Candidatus Kaiserbacteria bacterium]